MNPFLRTALILIPVSMTALESRATIVGTSLIYQPTYLGNGSQPDRIPLAPVNCNSNHGYGSYNVIFQPRPCYHGYFLDRDTAVFDQSLTSLFGVSADFSDTTQLGGTTVTFHLRPCKPPGNAPYSQELILLASLQCVLGFAHGLQENSPLTVVIQGDGMPTPEWATKYAKPYFNEMIPDSEERKPIVLPGLHIEESGFGVRYLVFEGVPANPNIAKRDPVFVPYQNEGECDNDGTIPLIPIWPGDSWEEPLNVLSIPYLPYFERWHQGQSSESIAIPHFTPPNPIIDSKLIVDRPEKSVDVSLHYGNLSPHDLAAFIFACVATEQPTLEHPLKISLQDTEIPNEYREILKHDSAWTNGTTCEFAIDPSTLKLTKGSVPGFSLAMQYRQFRVVMDEPGNPRNDNAPLPGWLADALTYIRNEAPAVSKEELAEIKQHPESPWKQGLEDRNRVIHAMLVLWKYDDNSTTLENMWFVSNDRVTRALAASLSASKRLPVNGPSMGGPDFESESIRFNSWECALRTEETSYMIKEAIKNAVEAWEKRTAEAAK